MSDLFLSQVAEASPIKSLPELNVVSSLVMHTPTGSARKKCVATHVNHSLFLSLSLSFSLSLCLSRSLKLSHSLSFFLPCTLTQCLFLDTTLTHSLFLPRSLKLSLRLSVSHSNALSRRLKFFYTLRLSTTNFKIA